MEVLLYQANGFGNTFILDKVGAKIVKLGNISLKTQLGLKNSF